MSEIEKYRVLNSSFKKTLVFNLGSESGFYSEFNNMVFGILYCLKYKYRFVLYSGSASFKIEKGWEDYFLPFCDSTESRFHRKYNKRFYPPALPAFEKIEFSLFRLFNIRVHFTHEFFFKFYNAEFEKEYFDIPELNIKGNLRQASREIVKMIYRYNEATLESINDLISKLSLPKKYAAIHIRRGDKDTEWKFIPLSTYMDKLKNITPLKDVFVFSDDYSVIDQLQSEYPEYTFYTLTQPSDKGYVHNAFTNQSLEKRRIDMVKMFSFVEAVCLADIAIGTYTTNPGLFFGMRRSENEFFSVQKASWYQFKIDDTVSDIVSST